MAKQNNFYVAFICFKVKHQIYVWGLMENFPIVTQAARWILMKKHHHVSCIRELLPQSIINIALHNIGTKTPLACWELHTTTKACLLLFIDILFSENLSLMLICWKHVLLKVSRNVNSFQFVTLIYYSLFVIRCFIFVLNLMKDISLI